MPEKKRSKPITAPEKLKVLCLIVNRNKTDYFIDLLQSYDVTLELVSSARGTAPSHVSPLLSVTDSERTFLSAVVKDSRCKEILSVLEGKFKTVRGAKGVAFTIPMTGIIGLTSYRFLSNNRMEKE